MSGELSANPSSADQLVTNETEQKTVLSGISSVQMMELAENALNQGDTRAAEAILQALASDPDIEVRTEARWRHALLMQKLGKKPEAALLLRRILDDKPDAQRVRLELAKLLFEMGDESGARRELRAAQAGKLPPEVAQVVEFFSSALRSRKPVGASIELAIAPDTNINRATRADTLDTIIAPLELSDDAKAQSGVGLTAGVQGYVRTPIDKNWKLLVRASGRGSFYRKSDFNDLGAALQIGAEHNTAKSRIAPSIGRSYRWFGGDHYATTDTASVSWQYQVGKRAQLETNASIGHANYKKNDLQDGTIYDADIALDRALSPITGVRLGVNGQRHAARDPGSATKAGGASLLAWHQFGRTSVFLSGQYRHLEADARIFLYPERRREDYFSIGGGATLRQFTFKQFAPLVRVQYEKNDSTVGIYDFDRVSVNLGLTRAF